MRLPFYHTPATHTTRTVTGSTRSSWFTFTVLASPAFRFIALPTVYTVPRFGSPPFGLYHIPFFTDLYNYTQHHRITYLPFTGCGSTPLRHLPVHRSSYVTVYAHYRLRGSWLFTHAHTATVYTLVTPPAVAVVCGYRTPATVLRFSTTHWVRGCPVATHFTLHTRFVLVTAHAPAYLPLRYRTILPVYGSPGYRLPFTTHALVACGCSLPLVVVRYHYAHTRMLVLRIAFCRSARFAHTRYLFYGYTHTVYCVTLPLYRSRITVYHTFYYLCHGSYTRTLPTVVAGSVAVTYATRLDFTGCVYTYAFTTHLVTHGSDAVYVPSARGCVYCRAVAARFAARCTARLVLCCPVAPCYLRFAVGLRLPPSSARTLPVTAVTTATLLPFSLPVTTTHAVPFVPHTAVLYTLPLLHYTFSSPHHIATF